MLICPKCHLEYYADETVCAVDAHPLDKVEDPRIGKLVGGRYVLDAVLGVGGMATVFRAHHTLINRVVAVKLLHPYIARSTRTCERFAREARAASAIAHPNVIEVFDFGKMDDGVPYLVMELLQGSPLRKLIDGGPMPLDEVVEIVIQLARGLARAHDLGVAHRDVKPENAFVERLEDGSVLAKLVDFGIAYAKGDERLTDADTIVGTPQYVSPERLLGNESGAASDLYSVGVMLFEMLAGVRPVTGEDARVIAVKVERGEVTPLVHVAPDAPREIAGLVHRAMAHTPDLRFASAAEMRLALEGALSGKRPPTAPLPVVQANVASLEGAAGTGTVLGAPVEAALKQPTGIGTAYGSTVRAAPPAGPSPGPMPMPAYTPSPPMDDDREASSGGGGGVLKALIALLVLGALGGGAYGIYWYVDSNGGGAPASTPTLTTAPPTVTPTTPTAQTAAPTGSLSPLTPATVTAPTTPTQTPSGKPTASTQPTSTPSGSATTEPTVPPIGPIVIPGFTNDAGVFTMPTTMPSFPFPFPAPSAPPP